MAWQGAPLEIHNASAHNKMLARNWHWLMARGILAILIGAVALLWPGTALLWVAMLFAAYMLIDGLFSLLSGVRAARAHERWGWLVTEGAIGIVAGALALVLPVAALMAFVLLASLWAVLSGLSLLLASFSLHRSHGRWMMLLAGLLSVVWGVLLFLAPALGAVVLALWAGAYAILFGALMIGLALRLRSRRAPDRPDMRATAPA